MFALRFLAPEVFGSTHWGTVEHLSTTKFSADQPESGNRFPGLSQLSAAAGNFCLVPTRPLSTFQTKRVHHQFRVSPPPRLSA